MAGHIDPLDVLTPWDVDHADLAFRQNLALIEAERARAAIAEGRRHGVAAGIVIQRTQPDCANVSAVEVEGDFAVERALERPRSEIDPTRGVKRAGDVAIRFQAVVFAEAALFVAPVEHPRPRTVPIGAAAPFGTIASDVGRDLDIAPAKGHGAAVEVEPPHEAIAPGQVDRYRAPLRQLALIDDTGLAVAEGSGHVAA